VQIPTLQPERFGYFEIPKYDQGSKEVEETVRSFADEYFGRERPDVNPTHARLLRADLSRKWMAGWKAACTQILQLDQQYLPEEFFFRVLGGEQGRGIRATKPEIQGPFNVVIRFNVLDLDPELVKQKLELLTLAMPMDVNGITDRNEALQVIYELIDPNYAERLLQPAESASLKEVEDEQTVLAKLLSGIAVDVRGNEAFKLRQDVLVKSLQNNSSAQRLMAEDKNVRDNVLRRLKQLDFNIQQKMVNPEIGRRLGTQPASPA
jgi:hypothetical protein